EEIMYWIIGFPVAIIATICCIYLVFTQKIWEKHNRYNEYTTFKPFFKSYISQSVEASTWGIFLLILGILVGIPVWFHVLWLFWPLTLTVGIALFISLKLNKNKHEED